MKRFPVSNGGLVVYAALSLLVVVVGFVLGGRDSVSQRTAASVQAEERPVIVAPASSVTSDFASAKAEPAMPAADPARRAAMMIIDRLLELFSRAEGSADDTEEAERLIEALVSFGEQAVGPLIEQIERTAGDRGAIRHDRLLDVLRRMPGHRAEERLVREARSGATESSRALAIDALAERHTDGALAALEDIAQTDSNLPEQPLITTPRDPQAASTELPDEVVFTPRMQAMAALASSHDPRAAHVLKTVLQNGPDESLRMEAARNLGGLRNEPGATPALYAAATSDSSPYVRLAALHALAGSTDPVLLPLLEAIASRDGDAGVRALASGLLAALRP